MNKDLSRSLQVFRESFNFIKRDKGLVLLPIISVVIISVYAFIAIGLMYWWIVVKQHLSPAILYVIIVILPAFYVLAFFTMTFFNAALFVSAKNKLDGKNPSLMFGLKTAFKRKSKIFRWVLLSSTLGIFLTVIPKDSKKLEKILNPSLNLTWSLLSFFVMPVLLFEDLGVVKSIEKSGKLFKKTWGANAVGYFSLTSILWAFLLVGSLPLILGFVFPVGNLPIIGLGVSLIFLTLLGAFGTALHEVYVLSLYEYASTGKLHGNFRLDIAKKAFAPERKR